MKKLIDNIKFPCKKCKTKDSIVYLAFDDGNEVEIKLTSCSKCGYETNFVEILKYL